MLRRRASHLSTAPRPPAWRKRPSAPTRLAQADADVAKAYAALLKTLDTAAGKALRADQSDFIAYRDQIAGFNENTPKEQQTFDLGEFVRDRATFLAGIRKPADAGLIGTWSSVRGSVEIKAADAGKFEISAEIVTNPVSGSGACDIGGTSRSARFCDLSTLTTTTNRPALSSPFAAMAMLSSSSRAAPARMTDRSRHHAAPTAMPTACSS